MLVLTPADLAMPCAESRTPLAKPFVDRQYFAGFHNGISYSVLRTLYMKTDINRCPKRHNTTHTMPDRHSILFIALYSHPWLVEGLRKQPPCGMTLYAKFPLGDVLEGREPDAPAQHRDSTSAASGIGRPNLFQARAWCASVNSLNPWQTGLAHRTPSMIRIVNQSTRAKRVIYPTAVIALVNFTAFLVVSAHLGGDALNGYIRDGHFFLCAHGICTQVNSRLWHYSYYHAVATICLMLLVVIEMAYFCRSGDIGLSSK